MITLDELKDKHIGKIGTPERDQYEFELKMEVLGHMIKAIRKERNLTKEEFGQLLGLKKSQVSKLERNTKNVTIDTILKVFNALKANVKFSVQMDKSDLTIA